MRSITRRLAARSARLFLTLCAVAPLPLISSPARAQSAGWPGPSYAGAESIPTGSKAESKLWWNDGSWWGCLWSHDAQAFTIHRLVARTETWLDTGTAADTRPKSRADCLWNGTKLYIASHQYTDGLGGPGHALELYRYAYDPAQRRYALDVGFPTLIADAKSETLVLDQDSTGTLWAAWTAELRVWVAHTEGDDRNWSGGSVLPMNTTDLVEDDIASLVAFGGKIGVLWSDQVSDAFQFSFHEDGAPANVWSAPETVLSGPGVAEDDIALRSARDGRVFAALGTGTGEVHLAVRGLDGVWADRLVAGADANWHHAILVLDESARSVHVFAATPSAVGAILEKRAAMDTTVFAPGSGSAVISDGSRAAISEATSTKQSVDGATGLVVLACHEPLQRYAHHHDHLGGSPPTAPTAEFHADVHEAFAPVTVQFLDASTGRPSAWSWDFGDGTTSAQRNPVHTYTLPGNYTVALSVSNPLGFDATTRADLVRIPPAPSRLVLHPVGDGSAYEGHPNENLGGRNELRTRGGRSSDYRSFLKFFLPSGIGTINGANLRLMCVDDSTGDNGSLYRVDNDWNESSLDWRNMPSFQGSRVASLADAQTGQFITKSVRSAVNGPGMVSFGIKSTSFHSVYYASRESSTPPELILDLAQGLQSSPEASFDARRKIGAAPLTVQFLDASGGRIEAWAWDFGDGAGSDLENPSHTFRELGEYTVSLTVTGPGGVHTRLWPGLVRVGMPEVTPLTTASATEVDEPSSTTEVDESSSTTELDD